MFFEVPVTHLTTEQEWTVSWTKLVKFYVNFFIGQIKPIEKLSEMLTTRVLLVLAVLFVIQLTVHSCSVVRCVTGNALSVEAEEVDINEISILETTELENDALTNDCTDKYVCSLSCTEFDSKKYPTGTEQTHFDFTNLIRVNNIPQGYNQKKTLGYLFKSEKSSSLPLLPLQAYFNGQIHYYLLKKGKKMILPDDLDVKPTNKPEKDEKKKETNLKKLNKRLETFIEQNELGFIISPNAKNEIEKQNLKVQPLYFHYVNKKYSYRVGRSFKYFDVKKNAFSASKEHQIEINKVKVKFISSLLGYLLVDAAKDTIPLFQYADPGDQMLHSEFKSESEEGLKGYYAKTYVQICSNDKKEGEENDEVSLYLKKLLIDHFKVDIKEFKPSSKSSLSYMRQLVKFSIDKSNIFENDGKAKKENKKLKLEVYDKMADYIVALRPFSQVCAENKYNNDQLEEKLKNFESSQAFKLNYDSSSVSLTPEEQQQFATIRSLFLQTIANGNRKQLFCPCLNFFNDSTFVKSEEGVKMKQWFTSYCNDKFVAPKPKSDKKDKKNEKDQKILKKDLNTRR
jgi:hypothetical protein